MALKLFRSTGYSTLLMPGEARLATHPLTLVLWASLWIGLVCNVELWRLLGGTADSPLTAFASAALITGGSGMVFSFLGWRRTLKPAITLALIAAALVACGLWSQQLPIETLWRGPSRVLLPPWASFLRWQVLALVLALAVVPIVAIWNVPIRRLPGSTQMAANVVGALAGALVFAAGLVLLP